MSNRLIPILLAVLVVSALSGCFPKRYNAAKGTVDYPGELGRGETVNVQVTRDGEMMNIVNGTAIEFKDIDL